MIKNYEISWSFECFDPVIRGRAENFNFSIYKSPKAKAKDFLVVKQTKFGSPLEEFTGGLYEVLEWAENKL